MNIKNLNNFTKFNISSLSLFQQGDAPCYFAHPLESFLMKNSVTNVLVVVRHYFGLYIHDSVEYLFIWTCEK